MTGLPHYRLFDTSGSQKLAEAFAFHEMREPDPVPQACSAPGAARGSRADGVAAVTEAMDARGAVLRTLSAKIEAVVLGLWVPDAVWWRLGSHQFCHGGQLSERSSVSPYL